MKRLVILLSLLMLFSFAFALPPWSQRYDTWQTFAATSIEVDQTLTFAVEWGQGGWDADGSNLGYGTSTDGTGWTWVAINWVQDGDGTNKRCSTTVTFDTPGTYYYAFRLTVSSVQNYGNGNNGWEETSLTLTDKISTEFFKVTVTEQQVPITLASFSAEAMKGKVVMNWVTESEIENDHFLIYRDSKIIATVGGNGTTTETHQYTYTDAAVEAGKVYEYMISDVSWGGLETVHAPVNVEVNEEMVLSDFVLNKVYPNPFNPSANIGYRLSTYGEIELGVYNMMGEKVADLYHGEQTSGEHSMIWNAVNMPSGIYFVRLYAGDMVQTQKIVLMK